MAGDAECRLWAGVERTHEPIDRRFSGVIEVRTAAGEVDLDLPSGGLHIVRAAGLRGDVARR
jgi:hypothetical protein